MLLDRVAGALERSDVDQISDLGAGQQSAELVDQDLLGGIDSDGEPRFVLEEGGEHLLLKSIQTLEWLRSGWHAELLKRMRLDLMPIRPAVIDVEVYDKLDELRRFRHLFRSLYTDEIDPLRMNVALQKARELRRIWPASIDAFLRFLEGLRSEPADR